MTTVSEVAVFGMVASWIALIFHEVGHALAARLVGVRIWGIRLGAGPVVWSRTVSGCRVQIALLPFLGSVQLLDADASAIGYRDIDGRDWRFEWGPDAWRAPIISAAGGIGNLIALFLLATTWNAIGQPAVGTSLGNMLLLGVAANVGGYLNLLPCFRSDGTHLLAHVRAARLKTSPVLSA